MKSGHQKSSDFWWWLIEKLRRDWLVVLDIKTDGTASNVAAGKLMNAVRSPQKPSVILDNINTTCCTAIDSAGGGTKGKYKREIEKLAPFFAFLTVPGAWRRREERRKSRDQTTVDERHQHKHTLTHDHRMTYNLLYSKTFNSLLTYCRIEAIQCTSRIMIIDLQ